MIVCLVNSAAANVDVHIFLCHSDVYSFAQTPGSGVAGSCGSSVQCVRTLQIDFHVVCALCHLVSAVTFPSAVFLMCSSTPSWSWKCSVFTFIEVCYRIRHITCMQSPRMLEKGVCPVLLCYGLFLIAVRLMTPLNFSTDFQMVLFITERATHTSSAF